MAYIEIQGLGKTFRAKKTDRHVLQDVNLSVERGEFISVVGFGLDRLMGLAESKLRTI